MGGLSDNAHDDKRRGGGGLGEPRVKLKLFSTASMLCGKMMASVAIGRRSQRNDGAERSGVHFRLEAKGHILIGVRIASVRLDGSSPDIDAFLRT